MNSIVALISQLLLIFVMVALVISGEDIRWLVYTGFLYVGIVINSKE